MCQMELNENDLQNKNLLILNDSNTKFEINNIIH